MESNMLNTTQMIGEGSWKRVAARIVGVWVLSVFAFAAIFLGFLNAEHSPVLQWVAITFAVVIAPAFGWYQAACQGKQSRAARAAKVLAILLLLINAVILAFVWLMADGLKHMR